MLLSLFIGRIDILWAQIQRCGLASELAIHVSEPSANAADICDCNSRFKRLSEKRCWSFKNRPDELQASKIRHRCTILPAKESNGEQMSCKGG